MRTILIAECATGHGGDLDVAEAMIRAAADSGCDYVKFQSYTREALNPADPQYAWLMQSYLGKAAHRRLLSTACDHEIKLLSTPFDLPSLKMLRALNVPIKIASTEASATWWVGHAEPFAISYPWGYVPSAMPVASFQLTAIPLYPTPLECVGRATLLDGWSDHCVGLYGCRYAMARGATVVEAHLTLPGQSRRMPWDKPPSQFAVLRELADAMDTIRDGYAVTFRERWRR